MLPLKKLELHQVLLMINEIETVTPPFVIETPDPGLPMLEFNDDLKIDLFVYGKKSDEQAQKGRTLTDDRLVSMNALYSAAKFIASVESRLKITAGINNADDEKIIQALENNISKNIKNPQLVVEYIIHCWNHFAALPECQKFNRNTPNISTGDVGEGELILERNSCLLETFVGVECEKGAKFFEETLHPRKALPWEFDPKAEDLKIIEQLKQSLYMNQLEVMRGYLLNPTSVKSIFMPGVLNVIKTGVQSLLESESNTYIPSNDSKKRKPQAPTEGSSDRLSEISELVQESAKHVRPNSPL